MTDQTIIDKAARVLRKHWSVAQETGEPDECDCCALALDAAGLLADCHQSQSTVKAERDDLESRLSLLLWELTEGRMSKPGYDVPTMVREVEASFERDAEEWHQKANACAEEALTVGKKLSTARKDLEALREQIGIEVRAREQWEANAETAEDQRDRAVAALERVRAVHREPTIEGLDGTCWECGGTMPCPTIRALDDTEATS